MTVVTTPRATYRSVFAVGEFRVLFAGMLMFVFGFEFEILGMSVLVYARTGSGFLAAVAFSMGFLPQAVGGAFLNSLADRLPPRTVIAAGLLARAAPGLVIGLRPELPVAAAAFLLCGFGYAYPLGIQQAFLDSLPARLRGQGFGLNTTGQMGGQGLLPPAAGGVAALAGPALAIAAAGAAVIVAASALRRPLTSASRHPAR